MSKEDRDDILAARAADAMARVASAAKGKDMSEWEDESGSRISQTTAVLPAPIHLIAGFIDAPSVYMGGPSRRAILLAEKIWTALKAEGFVSNAE